MKIAFIGTRGVPASYSGFETFVEQVGARLSDRGHDVTVYCRRHHFRDRPSRYRGMRLIHLPGLATKHLDTITHTAIACMHAITQRYDVVVMCISGNAPLALLLRLSGAQVVLNVDGSDWRRRKWSGLARAYIRVSEWLATVLPNATVTDSRVMQRYYADRFGAETWCIAYGSDLAAPDAAGALTRLGLEPRSYLLLVGRLVPENCADHLVDAYEALTESMERKELRCVIVGDAPYSRRYIEGLKSRGPNVLFPGYVFGDGYRELMHGAYAVVVCSEVGGTHPVLVEAMSAGNCVVVNNTPANLEVIDDAGLSYEGSLGSVSLRTVICHLLDHPELVEDFRRRASERARIHYSWESVTDQYQNLFSTLTDPPTHDRRETAAIAES